MTLKRLPSAVVPLVQGTFRAKDPAFVVSFLAADDCSDGTDNDGDGFVDFPYDPGCTSLLSTREISPLVPLFSSFGLCLLVLGLLLASFSFSNTRARL
ncbi:MAG: hypothetical protein ABGX04_10205 [Myxococcales bacterium]|nr:hypothetical protein [Myxococcales bacterium]HIK85952.1 hypothetical protein [Myxococcales bacterium]